MDDIPSSPIRKETVGGGKLCYTMTFEDGEYCFTISSSLFGEEYEESIKGLSSQREIADDFFELLVRNFVLPCTLKEIAEDYVFKIYSLDC